MDLDISWIWPGNVPAFQTKWCSYFTTPKLATKKKGSLIITMTSWFLWRLLEMEIFDCNLQELLLQSPADILDHPCWMNGWFRFLNHFQHQQLEGPLTRRWATSRRVSAPPGGDMTWLRRWVHIRCKDVVKGEGRSVTREMLLLCKLDELI